MLSAIRLIESGYYVRMISFDNGHMQNPCLIKDTADRIITHFGKEYCSYEGLFDISATVHDFFKEFAIATMISCPILHCACLCCCNDCTIHYIL